MAERKVIVLPGQCLEDIALQEYGNVDGVGHLLFDNRATLTDGFCTQLTAGMELTVGRPPINAEVHTAMLKLGVVPATDDTFTTTPLGTSGDYDSADYNDDHFIAP